MISVRTSSPRCLKANICDAIGWGERALPIAFICLKSLKDKGIHMVMVSTGQYIPSFKWLSIPTISRLQVELIWRSCTAPSLVSISDIDYIFFGTTESPRYFEEEISVYADILKDDYKVSSEEEKPTIKEEVKTEPDDREDGDGEHEPLEQRNTDPEEEEEDDNFPVIDLDGFQGPPDTDLNQLHEDLLFAGYAVMRSLKLHAYIPLVRMCQEDALQLSEADTEGCKPILPEDHPLQALANALAKDASVEGDK
ncbi:hypothetical protein R1sor_023828 [Riccia sorocarpa]|uniref:Uncharacterized protein n=1 Tax=Riccia sorocarpa TaxID=122646 RepID=A0ABD3GRS6_9MARC